MGDAREETQQKISLLHFQAAQLRLWKEKQTMDLSADLARAQADLARARAEIAKLRASLEALLASRSWRLTEPMRRVSAFIKSHAKPRQAESPVLADSLNTSEAEKPSEAPASAGGQAAYLTQGRASWDKFGRARFARFLGSNERIVFPIEPAPKLTIILVLHNQAHLSLLSLLSVRDHADVSYEVVVVDNGSDDQTPAVLARIQNATILVNRENRGFSPGCMQAVSKSRGEYLFFLNNDALLDPNSLQPALANFDDANVGAVGARILLPDGSLQEAGAILWCDGTTNGYGRDDNPEKLQYRFRRPVDYCSGASLFTPRQLFEQLGGFDQTFAPGYYEDLDYCMRLREHGFRSLYEPLSTVRHYENASSGNKGTALTHVIANHQTFWERWHETLANHYEPCGENIPRARIAAGEGRIRVLIIASQVPHPPSDGSYSRPWKLLKQLAAEAFVTSAAISVPPQEDDYADIPRDVELLDASANTELILRQNVNAYDVIWVLGELNLGHLTLALKGIDQITPIVISDLTPNNADVPGTLLENGEPSRQFESVLQRDLLIPSHSSGGTGGEGHGTVISGHSIRIWTVK